MNSRGGKSRRTSADGFQPKLPRLKSNSQQPPPPPKSPTSQDIRFGFVLFFFLRYIHFKQSRCNFTIYIVFKRRIFLGGGVLLIFVYFCRVPSSPLPNCFSVYFLPFLLSPFQPFVAVQLLKSAPATFYLTSPTLPSRHT